MRIALAWLILLCWWVPAGAQEAPEGPGHILYLDSGDLKQVARAWRAWVQKNPALRGAAVVGPPTRGWTALAVEALEKLKPEAAGEASRGLSAELGAGVLHLVVCEDRAYYFYAQGGKTLDRYCSNPGLPGEVSADVLRGWAGRPDVLLPVCRGRPLSATRSEVSLTDLNAILYFYYPEMRLKKPAAYRTPTEFMRLLGQIVGTAQPPAAFARLALLSGWKLLR